ncbi:DUF983 domain-containing protein [Niabella yanshanensis]|uniref:DUF983 domain-containing protein n=1 Tax=Niabella yanshanensis TaxID=577386 RepID=A0ABZ0W1I9_9BACT|nr:DUF983 domain-containing protein [Niabella yanshanensis]WQD36589.1 DUF983 domain-containing protein [Niabella yanshanensis]
MHTQTIPSVQTSDESKPGFLKVLQCKCPRCRKGNLFVERNPYKLSSIMKMNEPCPVCGQPFELEVGFYYGSGYISYALSIALSVASLIAWWVFVGLSVNDNRIFYWLIFNAVLLLALQPLIMRLARAIWLSFFVRYDKNWRTNPPKQSERLNKDQGNNW